MNVISCLLDDKLGSSLNFLIDSCKVMTNYSKAKHYKSTHYKNQKNYRCEAFHSMTHEVLNKSLDSKNNAKDNAKHTHVCYKLQRQSAKGCSI